MREAIRNCRPQMYCDFGFRLPKVENGVFVRMLLAPGKFSEFQSFMPSAGAKIGHKVMRNCHSS